MMEAFRFWTTVVVAIVSLLVWWVAADADYTILGDAREVSGIASIVFTISVFAALVMAGIVS